ncbi:hypothetical protein R6Q57_014799 [Mikania cordata]
MEARVAFYRKLNTIFKPNATTDHDDVVGPKDDTFLPFDSSSPPWHDPSLYHVLVLVVIVVEVVQHVHPFDFAILLVEGGSSKSREKAEKREKREMGEIGEKSRSCKVIFALRPVTTTSRKFYPRTKGSKKITFYLYRRRVVGIDIGKERQLARQKLFLSTDDESSG